MKFELKAIAKEGVPAALERARYYRALNEPEQAESICRDVLRVDANRVEAIETLVLALSDQVRAGRLDAFPKARELLPRLPEGYWRHYYTGLVMERRGRAQLESRMPGASAVAYEWFRDAMGAYEQAERARPAGDDDAILRWNTCARTIAEHRLEAPIEERAPDYLE